MTLPTAYQPVTPYLTVTDAAASIDFYQRAFGFESGQTQAGPDGHILHAELLYQRQTVLMVAPEGAWGGTSKTPAHAEVESPVVLYVRTPDVDALVERAREAGALVMSEPQDVFWGDRMARLADPDGYHWAFATPAG